MSNQCSDIFPWISQTTSKLDTVFGKIVFTETVALSQFKCQHIFDWARWDGMQIRRGGGKTLGA